MATPITVATASRKLDLTRPAIGKLIEKGALRAIKVNGEWEIDRDSFYHLLAARRRAAEEQRKLNVEHKAALLENQRRAAIEADRIQTEIHESISDAIYKLAKLAAAVRRSRADLFEQQEARI